MQGWEDVLPLNKPGTEEATRKSSGAFCFALDQSLFLI